MEAHVTTEDVRHWKRGELPADAVVAIARHVSECRECAALAASEVNLGKATQSIRRQIETPPRRSFVPLALAASLAALALLGLFFFRRPSSPAPQPAPPVVVTTPQPAPAPAPPPAKTYGRPDWDELIANVRSGTALAAPTVLHMLRPPADVLRSDDPGATTARLEPAGEVIESQRPRLSWPATPGATYNVAVFADGRAVARGRSLNTTTWTPSRPLPRGEIYTWEVEVTAPDREPAILPAPPAQPARFYVVSQQAARDLAHAREHFSDDPLLLGTLYACLGMDEQAANELRKIETGPDAATAKRLLAQLATWPE